MTAEQTRPGGSYVARERGSEAITAHFVPSFEEAKRAARAPLITFLRHWSLFSLTCWEGHRSVDQFRERHA